MAEADVLAALARIERQLQVQGEALHALLEAVASDDETVEVAATDLDGRPAGGAREPGNAL